MPKCLISSSYLSINSFYKNKVFISFSKSIWVGWLVGHLASKLDKLFLQFFSFQTMPWVNWINNWMTYYMTVMSSCHDSDKHYQTCKIRPFSKTVSFSSKITYTSLFLFFLWNLCILFSWLGFVNYLQLSWQFKEYLSNFMYI